MTRYTLLTLLLVTGCEGPAGADGANGLDGTDGLDGTNGTDGLDGADGTDCWDLDGDGDADPDEDINGDGAHDALDCRGSGVPWWVDAEDTPVGAFTGEWHTAYHFDEDGIAWSVDPADGAVETALGGTLSLYFTTEDCTGDAYVLPTFAPGVSFLTAEDDVLAFDDVTPVEIDAASTLNPVGCSGFLLDGMNAWPLADAFEVTPPEDFTGPLTVTPL